MHIHHLILGGSLSSKHGPHAYMTQMTSLTRRRTGLLARKLVSYDEVQPKNVVNGLLAPDTFQPPLSLAVRLLRSGHSL